LKFVVEKEWLLSHLDDHHVRVVDCRFSLADPEKGEQEYKKSHLPGAVYFDLEKDLSSPVGLHGGRHPLPAIHQLVNKLENAGIDENTVLVAYDNGEGAFAARFWWLLKYLGHEKVFVLNGGFKGWMEAEYPISSEVPSFVKSEFKVNLNQQIVATIEEVKEFVTNRPDDIVLIDSREEKRYLGIEEPIDKKAGHIPGAINKPWFEGLNNGLYKSLNDQKQRFSDLPSEKRLIVYCGSGVTAVPNFLALKEAGFEKVQLYLGSFSDWISYEENEIE
jgi:thiosulfate/3-mercaptopyruvate sulfurtransferase